MQQTLLHHQVKTYRQFASSYYVYEGFRITIAVLLPVFVLGSMGFITIGMAAALGALSTSLADNPGPLHHRINGMLATIALVFVTTTMVGFFVGHAWLLALFIFIFSFVFCIIGVNGARSASIGISVLLVMVLNIGETKTTQQIFTHASIIAGGGAWYFLLSLFLQRLRPYKLAQQAIGDTILSTSKYLRKKASLYSRQVNYDKSYTSLLEEQVQVHNRQNLVRELLFKTRSVVKDTTHTGRVLLMIFLDTVDLFERIMTSQRDYRLLHKAFDNDDVLPHFQNVLLLIANELDAIAIALQQGSPSRKNVETKTQVEALDVFFETFRKQHLTGSNLEAFISLRHILESIHDLHNRIEKLHRYTSFDKKLKTNQPENINYNQFVTTSKFNVAIVFNNLNLRSNIFRHSLRVSIAMLAGYLLSLYFPIGHSYWILLTIIVILKPAYSLTRQRNFERLAGTIAGAAIGALILYFIKDKTLLLSFMAVCMFITFSLVRIQYLASVLFMTIYLLIAFYFLQKTDFSRVVTDRVVDTLIGSVIALISNFVIPPLWEHEQLKKLLYEAFKSTAAYYKYIAETFTGTTLTVEQYKLLRKESFVSMANLSDSFQRMLSEPASKQKNKVATYQLVVSNHLLMSHIATLSSYVQSFAKKYASGEFVLMIQGTYQNLLQAAAMLQDEAFNKPVQQSAGAQFSIRQRLQQLIQKRVKELQQGVYDTETRNELSNLNTIADQFEYMYKISEDIKKTVIELTNM
jgi:uncharacterized membrane protein (TIGR01666 family)